MQCYLFSGAFYAKLRVTAAFLDYIYEFGFGEATNIHLPGETKGLVRSLESITKIDNAVMSFGQGISVTGLQMVAAVAAIGNDGLYIEPKIIKHQTDHNNLTISSNLVDFFVFTAHFCFLSILAFGGGVGRSWRCMLLEYSSCIPLDHKLLWYVFGRIQQYKLTHLHSSQPSTKATQLPKQYLQCK